MYHIELRQFPHNMCHFNLSEPQLATLVLPWVREEWIELGERKWNPNQATLKIVEGPELPLDQLTMGRGWRHAERQGQDVTERVLEAAKAQLAPAAQAPAPPAPAGEPASPAQAAPQSPAGDLRLLADSLGLELLALLDDGPAPLARVWLLAQQRLAGRPASECLALAERAVSSLLARGLVVLQGLEEGDGQGGGVLGEGQVEGALHAVQSWGSQEESGAVRVRRT